MSDGDIRQAAKSTMSGKMGENWWQGAVIYQVYPRSFLDTDNDGVGDLPGITEKLPYIASLNVDAVWLSPFFTSPMNDFGYDVADYQDVDPLFGTLADFDRLVETAHGAGLKIIIDQVYSHTSDQHAWFEESRKDRENPKADWYVWVDPNPDGTPPNNWQSVFGGAAWQWDNRRRQYYLHNFLTSQPDLNLHNYEVQDALLDVARFWLDRGVDGFRLDAINFGMHDPELRDNPPALKFDRPPTRPFDFQDHTRNMSHPDIPAFLERIRGVMDTYEDRFTVAEVGGPRALAEMKAFTQGEARLNSAYSFKYLYAEEISGRYIRETSADWPGLSGEGWPSWAFSNHDAPRAISRWSAPDEADAAARLFAMVLLSLRGNAFLYQGEELGLVQAEVPFEKLQDPEAIANWPETLGRDGARTPMPWVANATQAGFSQAEPWLPVDRRHFARAVDVQEADPLSMLNFTRSLLALRKAHPALMTGEIAFTEAGDSLLVLERMKEDTHILCVFNLGGTALDWQPADPDAWRVLFDTQDAEKADPVLPCRLAPWHGLYAVRKDA